MIPIYCVKCRTTTKTKSEKLTTTVNGRYRLAGICSTCGTKKGMFVSKDGNVTKTPEELLEAGLKRGELSIKKKAQKIGLKIMENDAEDCVKECIARMRKQKK
jgi:Domain of unknown function (DUF5679)